MSRSSFLARLSACIITACAAALVSAGIAFAAHQVRGASYGGTYQGRTGTSITFKVSANGKKVIDLSADTLFKCSGGCGGVGSATAGTAKISSKGTFKATLKIMAPGSTTKSEGTDTITGKFVSHGRAKGTVASHFKTGKSSDEKVSWSAVD